MLSRLEITWETMTEILSDGEAVTGPEAGVESGDAGPVEASGQPAKEEESRFGVGPPVGVRLVPQWSAERAVGALPRSYQDILGVLEDAVHPMRAHHICAAPGLSTDKTKVEGAAPIGF